MKVILNANQVADAIDNLARQIIKDAPSGIDIVVIGIRSRGETLAKRISDKLSKKLGKAISCGTLDITLYRDDLNEPHSESQPTVRSTEIPFDINGKIILLIDDVLYTGRSVRAAMDALMDLGRPKAVKLAVLVDRQHRELPIQANYSACRVKLSAKESVEVNLVETDDKDQVIVRQV